MKRVDILRSVLQELDKHSINEDETFYDISVNTDTVHLQGKYNSCLILAIRNSFDLEEECNESGHYIMTGTIYRNNSAYLLEICLT